MPSVDKSCYVAWDGRFFRLYNPHSMVDAFCEEYQPLVGFAASAELFDVMEYGNIISEIQFKREVVALQRRTN